MSILIIRPCNGIGDLIWSIGTIRGLSLKFGTATVVAKKRSLTKEWLSIDSSIKEVIYTNELKKLFFKKFDASCILHRSVSYSLIPFLLKVPVRMGFNKKQFINKKLNLDINAHPTTSMSNMLKELNIKEGDYRPPLINDNGFMFNKIQKYKKPLISLGIGCSEFNRLLPIKKFKQIIQSIDGTFFILGGTMDEKAAYSLQNFNQGKVINCTFENINNSFLIASYMDFYIGNDTGMMNVSAAFNIPSLVFFGQSPKINHLPNIYSVNNIKDCIKIIESFKKP